eukprot:gb/GEZN01007559.1/.p1 GENE.gb/GEZN01007559.1/~~gb/GEZN01007559.1/.p1  ORF type:complete len:291 (-),score=55.59 gb/GEZN01007559.1/:655-1455(-)
MSAAWLLQLEAASQSDTGKAATRPWKRRKQHKGASISLPERMENTRRSGLEASIPKDNVGFKLLSKMGYVAGTGLGKSGQGRAEPIDITLQGKGGVGHEKKVQEEAAQVRAKQKQQEQAHKAGFRAHQQQKQQEKKIRADRDQCQCVCRSLDTREGIEDNPLCPPEEQKQLEQQTGESVLDPDLLPSCPPSPPTYSTQPLDKLIETVDPPEEEPPEALSQVQVHLNQLLSYLRTRHLYCYYCAIEFKDITDMKASCPGPSRLDHED